MRRFTRDGQHWEIELDGKVFHVTEQGKTATRKFVGPEQALVQHDKAIATRLAEGWAEVHEASPPVRDERPLPTDDLDALSVRADELQTAGDWRGELIAIQLAQHRLAGDGGALEKRKKLARRAVTLADDNARDLFGPLEDHARATTADGPEPGSAALVVELRLGVAVSARLVATARLALSEIWPKLMALRLATTLESVTFGPSVPRGADDIGVRSYAPTLAAIAEHGLPPSVRELFFGDVHARAVSTYDLGDLERAHARLANVTRLRIHAGNADLGTLDLPALRELELEGACVGGRVLDRIGGRVRSLAGLEALLLRGDALRDPGRDALSAFRIADALPALRRLAIRGFVDVEIQALLDGELLARLTELDLSACDLRDAGGETILANAARFAHLSALDLRKNAIAPDLVRRLKAALPRANAYGQFDDVRGPDDADDHHYESVHE